VSQIKARGIAPGIE